MTQREPRTISPLSSAPQQSLDVPAAIPPSVLVVEDEQDIRELVSHHLLKEGYRVAGAVTGEDALRMIQSQPPDLVLLDLMLPGMDGLTLCRKLRADPKTASMLVLMLTAKGEEADVVAGLNLGANDYVTKPFSPRVLMARVRAVLRRAASPPVADEDESAGTLCIHNMTIHVGRHEVLVDDEPVELSATEFRLLHFLARRPGWVFTRQQILDGLHGTNYAITDRAVDVQIVGLRRRLGEAGRHIETVRGVGYRMKE
jgi:two-component system, OmpR family, alkaline phosphatase synthesis response regulator PhoP